MSTVELVAASHSDKDMPTSNASLGPSFTFIREAMCVLQVLIVTMASGGEWPSLDYLNDEALVCDLLLLQYIVIEHEPFNFLWYWGQN